MINSDTIYADYQATTPVDPRVLTRMAAYWGISFGNPHSSDHVVGWHAEKAVREAAATIASIVGSDGDEIVFTSGATEANNLALLGLARHAANLRRRILVSSIEHKCVLGAARELALNEGFTVETISVDNDGYLDLAELKERLSDDVLLVSVMAVNNEVGTIQDIQSISDIVKSYGALFHCDAAQAPCAMNLEHLATLTDLISLSGHKMYGPQGIGALYIRREIHDRIEPLLYGGGQQDGLRSGTVPLPLCVGMAAAAELIVAEGGEERNRIARQRDVFMALLKEAGLTIEVNGPSSDHRHPGNANIRFDGFDARDIIASLQPKLAASTGAACSSGIPEPSHVLRALGLTAEQSEASIRFSFGRFTTDDEIKKAANLVGTAVSNLAIDHAS
ncbi:MAG: cysteine desulfurase family protein [Gammaproteobacteria bacterium]|nr:cysteine desulfurase family protein [Gammaproteobacteria bacterium]